MTKGARRLSAVLLTLVALLLTVVAPAHAGGVFAGTTHRAEAPATSARVVLVGVPGLSWSDITQEDMPATWALASRGAIANLVVRSTYFTACPVDGWLGLSAGDRAAAPRDLTPGQLRQDPRALPTCARLKDDGPDAAGYRQIASDIADQGFDARPGYLGEAAAAGGTCITATGPGADLAARMPDGRVTPGAGRPDCRITLVGASPLTADADDPDRQQQAAAADAVVAAASADLEPGTRLLVAGLSDDGGMPGLRALVAAGDGITPGRLASDTTGQVGLAQVSDLTPTVLQWAGLDAPPVGAGRPLGLDPSRGDLPAARAELIDEDAQLVVGDAVLPTFFRSYGLALLGAVLLLGLLHRLGGERRRAVTSRLAGAVGLAALAMPLATLVATEIPWWRADHPGWALTATLALLIPGILAVAGLLTLGVAALVPAQRERRARTLTLVGWVAGLTAGAIALDLLRPHGRALLLGILGLHPLDGGRFHGLGNVPFALFATSALLATIAAIDPLVRRGQRLHPAVRVAVLGGLAFLTVALPWLGADGGGSLALVPAVGYLVLAVAGVRVSWRVVLGLGGATVALFVAMAALDWTRPEASQTHLGRFFQRLLDGEALGIIGRKLQTNVDILLGPERTALLVPLGLVLLVVVLARPDSRAARPLRPLLQTYPSLRAGLIAIVIALTAGFLLNDSGTAIPAVAALILLPALLVLAVAAGPPGRSAPPTPQP